MSRAARAVRLARRMAEGGATDDTILDPGVTAKNFPAALNPKGDANPFARDLVEGPYAGAYDTRDAPPKWAREAVVGAARPILDAGQYVGGMLAGHVKPTAFDSATQAGAVLGMLGPPGVRGGAAAKWPKLSNTIGEKIGDKPGAVAADDILTTIAHMLGHTNDDVGLANATTASVAKSFAKVPRAGSVARDIENEGGWTLDRHVPPGAALRAGFDQPTYHGTRSFAGQKIDPPGEFYSTPDPELATLYSGSHSGSFGDSQQVLPLLLRTRDYHTVDAEGGHWSEVNPRAIAEAREKGAPGVRINNVWDEPSTQGNLREPKTVFITLDPATVRSRQAQFDPAKMHLNDLLASGAAVAVPSGIIGEAMKAQAQSREGMAEGGVPAGGATFDPAEFDAFKGAAAAPASAPPAEAGGFDPDEFALAKKKNEGSWLHTGAEGLKGLARGAESFVGTMGEALAGPFGSTGQSVAAMRNAPEPTAEDLQKHGSRADYFRSKIKPDYGERLTHATGMEAKPQSDTDRYVGTAGEFLGNPASYLGPGAVATKAGMAVASGLGAQAGEDVGGTLGGIAGSLLAPTAAAGATRLANRIARRGNIPATQEIHDAANAQYNTARGLGVEIHAREVENLADHIASELHTEGYRDIAGSPGAPVFRVIEELREPVGAHATIDDIDAVRKALRRMGKSYEHRDAVRRATGEIDDFMANLTPAQVAVNPQFAPRVAQVMRDARGNYAAAMRAEDIEEALDAARNRAGSTGWGGNTSNAMRQEVRKLEERGLTPAEQAQKQRVARGSFAGNATRMFGHFFAPNSLTSLPHAAAIYAYPPAAAATAVGTAAKLASGAITRRQIQNLHDMVRARSPLAQSRPPARQRPASPFLARGALNAAINPYSSE